MVKIINPLFVRFQYKVVPNSYFFSEVLVFRNDFSLPPSHSNTTISYDIFNQGKLVSQNRNRFYYQLIEFLDDLFGLSQHL